MTDRDDLLAIKAELILFRIVTIQLLCQTARETPDAAKYMDELYKLTADVVQTASLDGAKDDVRQVRASMMAMTRRLFDEAKNTVADPRNERALTPRR